MQNYLTIHYDESKKPYTNYPAKLCHYLVSHFNIKTGSVMVDVGCGRGEFMHGFKQAGLDVRGLDIVRFEGKSLEGLNVQNADFEHEPFPYKDASIDLVFSKSVIEHLNNPANFIKECKRILKPNGRIVIMTPDWQSQRYIFYNDYTHLQPYTELGLARALEAYGFRAVHTELFYQLPSVWKYPTLKVAFRPLRVMFPIKRYRGNNIWRWSRELMILGTATA